MTNSEKNETSAIKTIENLVKIAKHIIAKAEKEVASGEGDQVPTMAQAMGLAEFCFASYKVIL